MISPGPSINQSKSSVSYPKPERVSLKGAQLHLISRLLRFFYSATIHLDYAVKPALVVQILFWVSFASINSSQPSRPPCITKESPRLALGPDVSDIGESDGDRKACLFLPTNSCSTSCCPLAGMCSASRGCGFNSNTLTTKSVVLSLRAEGEQKTGRKRKGQIGDHIIPVGHVEKAGNQLANIILLMSSLLLHPQYP